MSERRLLAPVAAVGVIAAALLVGEPPAVEDGEDPPSGAGRIVSAADFCAGFAALAAAHGDQLAAAGPETTRRLKDEATAVGDLAQGAAIPEEAHAGLVYVITAFLSLPDDATAQDLVESDDAATPRDGADADALVAWLAENCGGVGVSQAR